MLTLLYIHGFLSSPQSQKAQQTKSWLNEFRPQIAYYCPSLSSYPVETARALVELVQGLDAQHLCVIGSSMGGFWATWLVEAGLAHKAVLVNPAVNPHELVLDRIGVPLQSYYSEQTYCLKHEDAEELRRHDCATLAHPEKYWLMVQSGDETLDYQQAVHRYRHCRQLIERGGSHSYEGYLQKLPSIMEFFENP